jgi:hypothetical protein
MRTKTTTLVISILLLVTASPAQQINLPQNKNAALRYWMAFAEMQDRTVDESTTKLMEDVLSGVAPWDERQLGPVVDANVPAIRTMQKATALPECNWGLDYERGAAMSIGHLPKARALARLNALYGARQMAQGDADGAVSSWLAGLRFAQHISKDMSLIAVLSAKPAFLANLHLLTKAAASGRLSSESLQKVKSQIALLPRDGLEWSSAVRFEVWADAQALKYLGEGNDFQEKYKTFFSQAPPQAATAPTDSDIASYRALMNDVIAAFQLPYEQTKARLQQVETAKKSLHPAVQAITPSYSRLNENRHQVALELQELTKALAGQSGK